MPRRKRLTGKGLIRILTKADFIVIRVQGVIMVCVTSMVVTTVPVYAGETIGPGLLGQILRD